MLDTRLIKCSIRISQRKFTSKFFEKSTSSKISTIALVQLCVSVMNCTRNRMQVFPQQIEICSIDVHMFPSECFSQRRWCFLVVFVVPSFWAWSHVVIWCLCCYQKNHVCLLLAMCPAQFNFQNFYPCWSLPLPVWCVIFSFTFRFLLWKNQDHSM